MDVKEKKITVRELTDGYADNDEEGVRGFGGRLDIRPPYQREFIYKDAQRDKVIDTVAKGYPLNSMYWAVREGGDFEIIDGQQRTVSLCRYIDGRFSVENLFGVEQNRFFHNLDAAEQKAILDYELTVYQCSGENTELLKWFETINIAGEELTKQELLNAVYSGPWTTDAKKWFSKTNCQARQIGGIYLSGAAIRQAYLETAIRWISGGDIEKYMGEHQNDENAKPLWDHFESVIRWVEKIFPDYNPAMRGIAWGDLYREHKNDDLDAAALQKRINELMANEEVQSARGVYLYVLTGDEKHLNLRTFSPRQKSAAYKRQGGKCAKCGKPFPMGKMEGDHITPWSEGGKTADDNCQMLCKECNRRKSNR